MKHGHHDLCVQTIRFFQAHFEGRLFKRNIAKFKVRDRWLSYGIAGQADLYGWLIVRPHRDCPYVPVSLEIEAKYGADKLRPAQAHWRDFCRSQGVLWFVVRHAPDIVTKIKMECADRGYDIKKNDFSVTRPVNPLDNDFLDDNMVSEDLAKIISMDQ